MKVLVIDDTKAHLQAALQVLSGHDVTVVSTHEEAYKLLSVQYDEPKRQRLCDQYKAEGRQDYWGASYEGSRLPYWDAVLCDLLMPAGPMAQGEGKKYVGQEMAVGWALALKAAQNGAKYVAVVTDMNHHNHPASAMLDPFNRHFFAIDGARVLMTNYVSLIGITDTECTCSKCGGTGKKKESDGSEYECYWCHGSGTDFAVKGKNWGEILNALLSDKKKYRS